jgi:pectate lyase
MPTRRRTVVLVASAAAAVTLAGGGVLAALSASAAAGCTVNYTVRSQWDDGFVADMDIRNLGEPIDGWRVSWTFPAADQKVQVGWDATFVQNGATATAASVSYNHGLATGAGVSIGFTGTRSASNPLPSAFTLNGAACADVSSSPSTTNSPASTTSASSTKPPPAKQPTTRPPTQPPPSGDTGLVGWATQGGGTTGGGSAAVTAVASASALTGALKATGPAVIRLSGPISCSGMLAVASDKTIVGDSGATITGCGLNISRAKNVIVRNLSFANWNDDAINVQESTNVWIDHNTFGKGADGAVDIKRGSDFVTVSWNRITGHNKTMLLGHADNNAGQDRGRLRVTYHHNWFEGTTQRHPRVRFGNPVHVFNNYYDGVTSYGVAATTEGCVIVEGNLFEDTKDPFRLGAAASPPGKLEARNNTFVRSGRGQTGGTCAPLPYSARIEDSGRIKDSVTASAGAGRNTPQTRDTATVAADGTSKYRTVQAAIDAVGARNASRVTITIKPGTYREVVTVPVDKPHITLQGMGGTAGDVVIIGNHSAVTHGTFNSATAFVYGHDFVARNLTIANDFDESSVSNGAQAVALHVKADRATFSNVRLLGDQDTLLVNEGTRGYFVNSYIEGTVDFIFGGGTAVFDDCKIHEKRRGAPITAASTPAAKTYGFLFYRSTITGATDKGTGLGRPWRPNAQVLYRESILTGTVATAQPWSDMSGNKWQKARFLEYRNTGPGASKNRSRPQLSDAQAAEYTPRKYLAGSDGWSPVR